MNPETLANNARNSISSFCIEECKSYCCRKGYLILEKEEAPIVLQHQEKKFEEQKVVKKISGGKSSLFLGGLEDGCPSLKDHKCTIYTDKKRPKTCHDFPIFIKGNSVRFSPRCLAVKNNLFYQYVKQFMVMGFKIEETSITKNSKLFGVKLD